MITTMEVQKCTSKSRPDSVALERYMITTMKIQIRNEHQNLNLTVAL